MLDLVETFGSDHSKVVGVSGQLGKMVQVDGIRKRRFFFLRKQWICAYTRRKKTKTGPALLVSGKF